MLVSFYGVYRGHDFLLLFERKIEDVTGFAVGVRTVALAPTGPVNFITGPVGQNQAYSRFMNIIETLIPMTLLIGMGVLWQVIRPGKLPVQQVRTALTESVFYLFLPALVLRVLWMSPLGLDSVRISLVAAISIVTSMFAAWLFCRRCSLGKSVTGAVILAASFANVTYLGLPVLVSVLGEWAASVAIQFDLFASTPLLFTVGFLVAAHYGNASGQAHPVRQIVQNPPLWAALIAVLLNVGGVPLPAVVDKMLALLASAVIPLMLLALGMSLRLQSLAVKNAVPLVVVIVLQLVFMPLVVWLSAVVLGLRGEMLVAAVLEGAMPSMVIGLVICERYHLDTALYAAAVTVTTLLSLLSVPFWYSLLI